MIIYLEIEEILEIHLECLSKFGGAAGIRNREAILSAVAAPMS